MTMQEYQKRLNAIAANISVIEKAAKKEIKFVESHMVKEKLTGPRMPRGQGSINHASLAVGTGRLRNAARSSAKIKGKSVIASLIVGPVSYARAHEYGIGKMPERSYARASAKEKLQDFMKGMLDGIMSGYQRGLSGR